MSPRQTCTSCKRVVLVAGIYPPGPLHGGTITITCGFCGAKFTPPGDSYYEYPKEEAAAEPVKVRFGYNQPAKREDEAS